MDRLTLPRLQKTVDAGKCLPAGDSLPSWSNLPLDAKFPMVPNPIGTLTLFTSKCGTTKYRRKSSSDFDLTDPHGMSMSSEYHPLHDPHLRSHYSVPRMRRHLVRNGFITNSGMVICNLKEFNKYRQYLRRICLMELVRERTHRESSYGIGIGERASENDSSRRKPRFAETKRRHMEKIDAQRAKQEMMAKLKGEQMERKRREQRERHADIMRRKQDEDDRRRDTLLRNAEQTERRNMNLLRKWRRQDRDHTMRMEENRRQRESEHQRRNKDSWETRKRVQRERLDREADIREQLRLATERGIGHRNRHLARQRGDQMSRLQHLKASARAAREERNRICEARLARRIAAAARRAQRRYRSKCNRPPFRSEWTLQQVLRRLSFADLVTGSSESLELMQMINAVIDEAVQSVTSRSDVDGTSEGDEEDLGMQRFASDLVASVVSKVKNDIYPAYLRMLESGEQASLSMMDSNDDLYDDYMYDQSDLERPDTGTDEELCFIAQNSEDSSIGDSRRRSVRFSFDESIIPSAMDSLDVSSCGSNLKPVSEHMLTPVPSPLPGDPLTSAFDFDVKEPSMPTKIKSGFVESLLLRLLDDLNNRRIKRDDLVKLTGYCMDILRVKDVSGKRKGDDVASSPSDHVADYLVSFTLSKILDDIRSGSDEDISDQDLDRLISATLSSAAEDVLDKDDHISDSMLEDFVTTTLSRIKNDQDLDRLISATLSSAAKDVLDEDDHISDSMLEDFVTTTLSRIKNDQDLDRLISATLSSAAKDVLDEDDHISDSMLEDFVTTTLSKIKNDQDLDRLISATLSSAAKDVLDEDDHISDSMLEDFVTTTLSKIKNDQDLDRLISATLSSAAKDVLDEDDHISDSMLEGFVTTTLSKIKNDQDLDRLISATLSSAAKDVLDEDDHISDSMLEDFVTTTLRKIKNDLESKIMSQDGVREIGLAVVNAIRGRDCRLEGDLKKTLNDVLDEMETNTMVGAAMDKVVTAIVSSYHTVTSKEEKTHTEMIEDFVSDILTQLFVSIKAGEFSEHELLQIISTRHDSKRSKKDYVQGMIDSVLYQIDSGNITEEEIQDIGNALIGTGRKLLTDKGFQISSAEGIDPMEMTSTEIADKLVKEVIDNIREHMDDDEFEKEALKALAASFLKVRSSTMEGISNVPTIGSSPGGSYMSTMKRPSPTESSLATDVVFAAIDRITRDLTERNIPAHMLSSIACSLAPQGDVTPSIYLSEGGLDDADSLPQGMKMTLTEITCLLSEDRVGFDDAKKIFAIILQSYLIGHPQKCSSHIQIDESDSFMIENLIRLTLNKVMRSVTEDVSLLSLPLSTDTGSLSIRRLSSVISGNDLEKLIWDTLHRIGQEASMESVLSRPPTPAQFKSYSSVDSQNIESLVRQTLVQVAQDIAEGITSDTSLVDTKREVEAAIKSSSHLSSNIVGFVNSVLQELIVGLERGSVSRDCVAQFMTDICPGKDFINMDVELLHKDLRRVVNDVSQRRTASVYFHAISDRFSAIKSYSDRTKSVMTPELKNVCNILSSVDAGLLIKFVQATLLTVLGGMQTPRQSFFQQLKPESVTSLLKQESSVIARNVVNDLIRRIQSEVSNGVLTIDEGARKRSSTLADRLVDDLIQQIQGERDEGYLTLDDSAKLQLISKVRKKSSHDITAGQRKESSEVPKETESYVLQSLKSVVSEKRQSTDDGAVDVTKGSSILLEEFLYSHLQDAVESIQNRTTESAKSTSDSCVRGTSSLVLETLTTVIADMIIENALTGLKDEVAEETKEITSSEKSSKSSSEDIPLDKGSSSEVAKFVLVTLTQALAETKEITSSEKSSKSSSEDIPLDKGSSSEVAKFVLGTLTRALAETKEITSSKKSSKSSSEDIPLDKGSSSEVAKFVLGTLTQALAETKEITCSEKSSKSSSEDIPLDKGSSSEVAKFVLGTLTQALAETKEITCSEKSSKSSSEDIPLDKGSSSEVAKFVLGTLTRALAETKEITSSKKSSKSSSEDIPLDKGSSSEVAKFVLGTLTQALAETKEITCSEKSSKSSSEDIPLDKGSSSEVAKFVLGTLTQALAETKEITSSEKSSKSSSEDIPLDKGSSSEVAKFVLGTLTRALAETKEITSSKKSSKSSSEDIPLDKGSSSEVAKFVLGTLTQALAETKEITCSEKSSKSSSEDIPLDKGSSSEVAKFVLGTLTQALADDSYPQSDIITRDSERTFEPETSQVPEPLQSDIITRDSQRTFEPETSQVPEPLQVDQAALIRDSERTFEPETSQVPEPLQVDQAALPHDTETKQTTLKCVNDLVAEVISQTIANIKQGKLSQMELSTLVGTLTGTNDQPDGIHNTLVNALEGVKTNIVHGVVSSNNMETVAQQIATLPLDSDDKVETDTDSSIHSMAKDVVSQIVLSLGDAERNATADVDDEGIKDLAKLSLVQGGPAATNARNSFRSLVQPESADKMSVSKTSMDSPVDSDESRMSVNREIVIGSKDRLPKKSSGRVTNEGRKETSKQQSKTSFSSVSSGDSHQEQIVKRSQSKDATSLKSSSTELKQSRSKKMTKSSDTSLTKKSSLKSVKSRDSSKRVTIDQSVKVTASLPAITIDNCSSNMTFGTSCFSSSSTISNSESQQEPKTQKVKEKQERAKNVPTVKVTEASDPDSNGSDVSQSSSQADAMKVRSVCGSHTTQVRVRDSQADVSQE